MGITRPAVFPSRWYLRVVASALGLAMLVWVGAMSPHLVHHLFDEDHGQVCLMFEQADGFPCLVITPPSLVLPQTPQLWLPVDPLSYPPVHRTVAGSPRAPPSMCA
jgi:hypothetical protein